MSRILKLVVAAAAIPVMFLPWAKPALLAECPDPDNSTFKILAVDCFTDASVRISVDPPSAPNVAPHADADGSPSRCNYIYDWTYDPDAPDADPTINGSGRRQDFYWLDWATSSPGCDGYLWLDAADPAVPAITAADLVPGVWVRVQRELPTPIPRVAPADFNPKGYAYVQNPTFFWVDQAAGQWAPVTGSASGGGITVSVRADPVRLIVSTGDGGEVVCEGAPPPFRQGNGSNPADFRGCEYTYHDSSAMAENGETFPLTMTVEWSASWSASTGEGGSFGTRSTTSEVRWLPVAEIQSIITNIGG